MNEGDVGRPLVGLLNGNVKNVGRPLVGLQDERRRCREAPCGSPGQ